MPFDLVSTASSSSLSRFLRLRFDLTELLESLYVDEREGDGDLMFELEASSELVG